MAVTHTPDTDIISVRNAMIDRLAWDLIGMATDRAEEIIDLANQRAHSLLRSPGAQVAHTSAREATPPRVLSLPLAQPDATPQPPSGAGKGEGRRRTREVTPETRPTTPSAAPDGNRGAVKASVLAHLQAHPGVAMTVNTVAKAVDKAAGSVGAALDSLTKCGDIDRVGDAPKTYAARGQA